MKKLVYLYLLLLTLLVLFSGFSQSADTVHRDTTAMSSTWQSGENISDDDFAPGLLFMTFIGIGLIAACIGIGSIVSIAILLLLFAFISVGILSSSIIIGLSRRSLTAGFKTFIISITIVVGIILGITTLYLANYLFDLQLAHSTTLWMGAGGGLMAGVILGLLAFVLLQQLLRLFKQHLGLS
jgi:hypothetical protein